MKQPLRLLALLICLVSLPALSAEQFVEISVEIESHGYRLKDSEAISRAKPGTVHVTCVAGPNSWYIEEDSGRPKKWLWDGTNVTCKWQQSRLEAAYDPRPKKWESRDGRPMQHFSVNIPWLAFCSGTYLKGEGRMIPLPAALLEHCPDRFAYSNFTTTFPDELGLPRNIDLFSSSSLFLKSHTDWDKECGFGDRYTEWNKKTAPKI